FASAASGRTGPRSPAWAVQPDPSLQRVAETVRRWRAEGKLTANDRAFPFHPDVANYLAWFCPGEKVFVDGRLALSAESASQYVRVCRQLARDVDLREESGMRMVDLETDWQGVFRDRGITYLILHDPDQELFLRTMRRLTETPQWALLRVDGQALLYGWRGAGEKRFRFDGNRLAFGPPDEDFPPAPGEGPGRDPHVPPCWKHDGLPGPAPAWESAAAATFLRLFDNRLRRYPNEPGTRARVAEQVSLVLQPLLPGSPLATAAAALTIPGN